ncbi:MAG: hypothetical protein K0Q49_2318 [Haloplasmataceae bacterium]|jgi:formamidopyrimidine-DNA glycosylase|nr:hypothetical protein [Haloplasmataceae bacterium]
MYGGIRAIIDGELNNNYYLTHLVILITINTKCSVCSLAIKKEAYLGGSIYYCEGWQK